MKVFTYQELRSIIIARRLLRSYGFCVDLTCGCDEDNPQRDCLSCQMASIKAARRVAMAEELAAKEKQRKLSDCERYLMTHGYQINRPDGSPIPLTMEMLEHRVRCGTIEMQHALEALKKWGKDAEEADKLMANWMWPKRYERKS